MNLNRDFFLSSKRTAEVQKEIVPVEVLLIYLNSKGWNKFPCYCQKRRIWDAFTLSLALPTLLRQDPVPGEGALFPWSSWKTQASLLCVLFFLFLMHRLYHKHSSSPWVQLMPTKAAPAQLVLAMDSSACIVYSSYPSSRHLSPRWFIYPFMLSHLDFCHCCWWQGLAWMFCAWSALLCGKGNYQ